MKKLLAGVVVMLVSSAMAVAADSTKVQFVYDVAFDLNFDNREVDRSSFTPSMTIFGVRLTPTVGFDIPSDNGYSHRVVLGIDVMKDFGSSISGSENLDLFRELNVWYRMQKRFGRTDLALYAGVFPRSLADDRYSEVFFSDSLRFYDNNLEGLLLKFKRPKASFEVGCDWMGQVGQTRRERFMIFSSGEGQLIPSLSLGYAAYMYHFAGSRQVKGVVDNVLINPYMRFDLGHLMDIQRLSVRLGWLQGMQNDRKNIGIYSFPCGGEFDLEAGHWNAGIRNRLFYGTDMMPYYNFFDGGGLKYGNRLYLGDPFYRIHDNGNAGPGIYDRFEFFWEPYVGRFLQVRLAAVFHFNGFRYSGCQQIVTLKFRLAPVFERNDVLSKN
ncbi:MAG: hypothetical protein IJ005_00545 [Bacteroidales bacterium]|nr:hypothetical protein [Bacteroidales bacterium]